LSSKISKNISQPGWILWDVTQSKKYAAFPGSQKEPEKPGSVRAQENRCLLLF
jgi:hypothetical protein